MMDRNCLIKVRAKVLAESRTLDELFKMLFKARAKFLGALLALLVPGTFFLVWLLNFLNAALKLSLAASAPLALFALIFIALIVAIFPNVLGIGRKMEEIEEAIDIKISCGQ